MAAIFTFAGLGATELAHRKRSLDLQESHPSRRSFQAAGALGVLLGPEGPPPRGIPCQGAAPCPRQQGAGGPVQGAPQGRSRKSLWRGGRMAWKQDRTVFRPAESERRPGWGRGCLLGHAGWATGRTCRCALAPPFLSKSGPEN